MKLFVLHYTLLKRAVKAASHLIQKEARLSGFNESAVHSSCNLLVADLNFEITLNALKSLRITRCVNLNEAFWGLQGHLCMT